MPASDKLLAGTVLTLWGAAITAGRLTAYDSVKVQWKTAVATLEVTVLMLITGFAAIRLFGWIRSAISGQAGVAAAHCERILR